MVIKWVEVIMFITVSRKSNRTALVNGLLTGLNPA